MRIQTLAIIAILNIFPSKPTPAQIENDSVRIGEFNVAVQRMTLSCLILDPGTANMVRMEFNLHLTDLKRAPYGTNARVAAHGIYWWGENRWQEFSSITENTIRLSSSKFGKWDGMPNVACANIAYDLDRNTLDLNNILWISDAPYYLRSNAYCKHELEWFLTPDIGQTAPKMRNSCNVLKYRAPPERIGF